MSIGRQKTDRLETDFLLLQQIGREYDSICRLYGLDLVRPVFELLDSTVTLGRWESFRRVLGVSRNLINQMPWNITLEVVKHEMAHQVCDEIYGMEKLDHGRQFHDACEMLQVKYLFRRANTNLEGLQAEIHNASSYSDDIKEKVKKLLALSQSSNEHESALAFEKARKLMEKHSFIFAEESLEEVVHEVIETKRKRLSLEQSQSMALISKYFKLTVISSWQYDPLSQQSFKAFEIVGRRKDVAVAVHCYFFLQQQLASAWKKLSAAQKGKKQSEKNGFMYGMLTGFEEKLAQQFVDETKGEGGFDHEKSWQLTVVNDKDVVEYCRKRFPHLRKARSRTLRLEHDSYSNGFNQGKKLNLYKAMQGSSGQKRLN